MPKYPDEIQGPVMNAAKMALATGNVNYVLIWVPEESENTLKNLLEKTCCERSSKKNMQNQAYDWFSETVNRFHNAGRWPDYPPMKFERLPDKPIVLKVYRAIETGNFEEIRDVIPVTHAGDAEQRFQHVMNKRNYPVDNIAAGRAYVSAFFDFTGYVDNLSSTIRSKEDRGKHKKMI